VLHRNLDAETTKLAARLNLHLLEALGIHVARMRIEAGEHAIDGVLDERLVFGHLDVVGADTIENIAEEIELLVCIGICGAGAVKGVPQQCSGYSAGGDQCNRPHELSVEPGLHQFMPFWLLASFVPPTHHLVGSIAVPALRNSTYMIGLGSVGRSPIIVHWPGLSPISPTGSPATIVWPVSTLIR